MKLPAGLGVTKTGKVINKATKVFQSVEDVAAAMKAENAARYAKYLKPLKFLGVVGMIGGAAIDPAMAIYNGASDEEIQTQLAGAIGSIGVGTAGAIIGGSIGVAGGLVAPGVGSVILGGIGMLSGGVIGSLLGEAGAEKLARALLTGTVPSEIQTYNGDRKSDYLSGAPETGGLNQYTGIRPEVWDEQYGSTPSGSPTSAKPVTSDALRSILAQPSPVKVGRPPSLTPPTIDLMQNDAAVNKAEIEAYLASVQTQPPNDISASTINNNTNQTSNSYLLGMSSTVDVLDAGFAFGGGR